MLTLHFTFKTCIIIGVSNRSCRLWGGGICGNAPLEALPTTGSKAAMRISDEFLHCLPGDDAGSSSLSLGWRKFSGGRCCGRCRLGQSVTITLTLLTRLRISPKVRFFPRRPFAEVFVNLGGSPAPEDHSCI